MKFLAEVISNQEIAVWFVQDTYIGETKDGIYKLIGRIRSPLFPNYMSIEYKNGAEKHFKVRDYEALLNFWQHPTKRPFKPQQPPFELVCLPHLRPSTSKIPIFIPLATHGYPITVEKVELTDTLKETIKQQFIADKNTFDGYHSDTRAILIGTI